MAIDQLSNIHSLLALLKQNASPASGTGNPPGNFAASLALFATSVRLQNLDMLTGAKPGAESTAGSNSIMDLLGTLQAASGLSSTTIPGISIPGLSATGRNPALFDPESAYTMMSQINRNDVTYKAQFAQLSSMKTVIAGLQQQTAGLGSLNETTANDRIRGELEKFAARYNDWIQAFDADLQPGGILNNVQAAEVARHGLKQSVNSFFHGAAAGVRGLRDLGLSIDPATNLAVFDVTRLESTLGKNRTGAISALQEFSASFTRAAELLNTDNNFIARRLNNLGRAIDYFAERQSALQSEFGLGDPAQPDGRLAEALAAYQSMRAS